LWGGKAQRQATLGGVFNLHRLFVRYKRGT
jgi:hypothetical protein